MLLASALADYPGSAVYPAAGVSVIGNTISNANPLIMAKVDNDATIRDNIVPKGGEAGYLH
ncbi:MAG TPA: hypothetical protein DCP92_05410 [Nitrospiraceae bacterium]|jgi:hypothetical protein|nr:hypothetical protein [Nitrospiraceae bacterium]